MRFLVTAGPTREFMDPVRFISNRSSGKMGYAIAAAARDRGHEVVLISGPVTLPAPTGVSLIPVVSADDMLKAVSSQLESSDVLIMAAAVADWRPTAMSEQKLKKLKTSPVLHLEATPDILQAVRPRKGGRLTIGFAAETEDMEAEARRKVVSKGLDMIVANNVSQSDAGFDVDTNRVVFVTGAGSSEALPLMSKREVAERLVDWVETRSQPLGGRGREPQPRIEDLAVWNERLARQLEFIREIDKLKSVFRRTLLMDGTRFENDAEHSWHLAMMAILLKEHASEPGVDIARVVKMVLVHDLVEIDAGDTYCYDVSGNLGKADRERGAATRLFGMLPGDAGGEIRALWEEFEARSSPEAKFAAALDRVQPLIHNYSTGGAVWRKHGVRCKQVLERNRHVEEGSGVLWRFSEALIKDAVKRGYLETDG